MEKLDLYYSPPERAGKGRWKHSRWLQLIMMFIMLFAIVPSVMAEAYITEMKVLGKNYKDDINSLKNSYKNNGWTIVEKDLNTSVGGYYIYLAYKTAEDQNPQSGYITDVVAIHSNKSEFTYNNRKYKKVPTDGFDGDLNKGASGSYIYLYYTTERTGLSGHYGTYRSISKISTSSSSSSQNGGSDDYGPICWAEDPWGACDANKNCGSASDYIYIRLHFRQQKLTVKSNPTAVSGLVYNGSAQNLVKAPSGSNWGTMYYKLGSGSWSKSVPSATNVGTYTVTYHLEGSTFADDSDDKTLSVEIKAPESKTPNVYGSFDQRNKKVTLTWDAPNVPGDYTNYKWVVYRGDTKLGTVASNATRTWTDTGFTNESEVTYNVYYVSNTWDENTKNENCVNFVKVKTTREVPVQKLTADPQESYLALTWSSTGYPANWGNKFYIFVDDETTPVDTITPTAEQTEFRWEHRYTDQHNDRLNGKDGTTYYTEERNLGACTPHSYRVEGWIDTKKLNEASVEKKSIGAATAFYDLEATKGNYPGQVKVSWHVDNRGTTNARVYIISRRVAENTSAPWDELARVESAEEYQVYTDDSALPGVYYDYRVTVVEKCDNGNEVYNDATDIGFAMAKGAVSGRVTYGSSGSSVEGVEVIMEKASASDVDAQYYSMYFSTANGKVTWNYPTETYAADKFASGDFSVQMWVKPTELAECWIARFKDSNGALGMSANGEIQFSDGSNTYNFGLNLIKDAYSHVTLTRQGTTLTCYLITYDADGNPKLSSETKEMSGNLSLSGATQYELGYFAGYVDEFRLWTKCLTKDDIEYNYDRLVVGNEKDLETYWNFDEGLKTQFFDYSREGTVYHQHHGKMVGNAETKTDTPANLALKAKTDNDGNYVIQGIPFTGEGTNYNVRPSLNSHEFSPQKLSRFFSASSQVHNSVDFTDVSSFEVSGKVMYAGTNIPVDSVQIYVDGRAVSRNGEQVQTNDQGEFVVDVPIGSHYLTAVRDGHTFVDGGRIPADPSGMNETSVEFNNPLKGLVFTDNTLVTVAGRVVGGAIEGEKPLGFGLSKNNIGKAVITLEIPNKNYMINCYEDFDGLVSLGYKPVATNTNLTHPADMPQPGEAYLTGGTLQSDAQNVVITTDAETGEFGVMLPPLDYKVVSVVMENDEAKAKYTFDPETLPRIEASYAAGVQKDSTEVSGIYNYFEYTASFKQTVHTEPVLSVKQEGAPDGVFGDTKVPYTDPTTNKTTYYDTYTKTGDAVTYTFAYPIFGELGKYTFNMEGYELYTNYEKAETDADRVSKVPLRGMIVTISNPLSASHKVLNADAPNDTGGEIPELEQNQMPLDENGKGKYVWQAGLPNIQAPYVRPLTIMYNNGAGEYSWEGPDGNYVLDGIIFGDLPSGTNFTTKGPSEVEMILHDPYGDSSFATWETGTVTVQSKDTLGTHVQDNGLMLNAHLGPDFSTDVGFGVSVETSIDVIADTSIGFDRSTQNDTVNTHTTTIELTRSISTSAEPDFIGADGDLYIGKSTNLLFGKARSVGLIKDESSGEIVVGADDAITVGKKFATNFVYTEYHIINILIPNLMMVRNDLLTHVDNMATATNETNEAIYVTDLLSTDPNYGTKGTYKMIPPKGADGIVADMVGYYNDEIKSWESVIAQNEKYKLDVFASGKDKKNSSFGGGSEITETSTTEKSFSRTISYTHNYTLQWSFDGGYVWNGLGADIETWNNTTWENAESSTTETTNTTSFSYTLADSGSDDSFSMDIYPASGTHGPVFRTMGGQSSSPYEGQVVTKYYKPGTELSTATMQIEDPELTCSRPMLTGVPTGGKAQFQLELKNNSVTNTDCWFNLVPVDGTNPLGALLSLPTGPIGNGHAVMIPAGETVYMTLTLEQGNLDVIKYSNIQVALKSQGQDDPTSVHGEIASYLSLSAEFVPASTPVNMTIDQMVVNTTNVKNGLNVKVTGFDRNFSGLTSVDIQYLAPGEQQWSLLKSYIPSESVRQNNSQTLLPDNGVIALPLDMTNADWKDGTYKFRARSYATHSSGPVTSESDIITVVKDLSRPQIYGLANPSDGVLNSGDEISLTFNEDIQKGLLTDNNFVVSGVLNGAQIKHDVALSAQNTEKAAYTEATYNLANKDFSADMWVRVTDSGEIFAHGSGDNKFKLSVDADDKLVISIGDQSYTSAQSLEKNMWTFLAFSYDYEAGDSRLSARAVTDNGTTDIFNNKAVADYDGAGSITLGQNFSGAIHELTLWDKIRTMGEAQATMHETKKASTPSLIGYWKMDEGDGKIATDYARSRHLTLPNNSWYLNNDNKAVTLDGTKAVKIDISACSPAATDSYAMEMWFKGAKADNTAASTLFYATNNSVSMGFDANGLLTMTADGQETEMSSTDYLDNAWHHLALNVLRSGNATVYVDGAPVKSMSASTVPALEGSNLYIGSRAGEAAFKGSVDEIRLWNAQMTGDIISSQRTQRLTGDESGLVAYYSFEQSTRDASGLISSVGSAKDLCTGAKTAEMTSGDIAYSNEAPAMKVKPEATNVGYTYVANERGIVITLNEDADRLEGSTIKFIVRGVNDMNGNESSAITWTAFVQQNSLKWKDDTDIVLEKPVGETATFQAVITNESGDSENWMLSGLPTWITADATSGTLKAQLSKTITFTVDESVASGKYEQTIYLTGNKNISEPLTLYLKVKTEEPDWAVNPADYEETMNMIGSLKVLGVPSQDEDDIVGVFIDDVCRGVARPEYIQRYDGYFYTMDIYGNGADGEEELTIKVFDASDGVIYPVVTTTLNNAALDLKFVANDFKGTYKVPVITDATDMIEQNIALGKGWNWMSFGVKPETFTLDNTFANAAGRVLFLKNNAGATAEYDATTQGWATQMTALNNTEMYAVQTSEAFTLNVTGHRVKSNEETITLAAGWNWLAFNPLSVMSLTDAFADMNPQTGDIVKGQRGVAYYDEYTWVGSLKQLTPGLGYKMKVGQASSFTYPTVSATGALHAPVAVSATGALHAPVAVERPAEPTVFTPVDYRLYPANMVVIAQVVRNGQPVAGAEVGVYAGNECREAAVTDERGMIYITVPGSNPADIRFFVALEGEILEAVGAGITYETDAVYGSPSQPLCIDLNNATAIHGIGADGAAPTIYDLAGRKMYNDRLARGIYIVNKQKQVRK